MSVDEQTYNVPTTYGCLNAFLFKCLAVGFLYLAITNLGKQKGLIDATRKCIAFFSRHGHKVENIRTDYGTCERSEEFDELGGELGFCINNSPPSYQSSNPVERSIQTANNDHNAIRLNQNVLGKGYWGPGLFAVCDSTNRRGNELSRQIDPNKSPLELVTKERPNISKPKFAYGTVVTYPATTKVTNRGERNRIGVAVGATKEGTLVVEPPSKVVRLRGPGVKALKIQTENLTRQELEEKMKADGEEKDGIIQFRGEEQKALNNDFFVTTRDSRKEVNSNNIQQLPAETQFEDDEEFCEKEPEKEGSSVHKYNLRSKNGAVAMMTSSEEKTADAEIEGSFDKIYVEEKEEERIFEIPEQLYALKARKVRGSDNPSYSSVMKDPEQMAEWAPFIAAELESIRNVSDKVTYTEMNGQRPLPLIVDLKIKRHPDGTVDSHKCRMPVDGSVEIRQGMFDNTENYSPNLKAASSNLIIAMGVYHGWIFSSTDIKSCFLQTPLDRVVYIVIHSNLTGGETEYRKLGRAMYGLGDAGRLWYKLVIPILIAIGFVQTMQDPCILIWIEEESFLVVGLTTDDFENARSKDKRGKEMLDRMHEEMKKHGWEFTTEEPLTGIIGVALNWKNDNEYLTLLQTKGLNTVFDELFPNRDTELIPYVKTPMKKKWDEVDLDNSPKIEVAVWLRVLGLFAFITKTRLAIKEAFSKASTRTSKCTEKDLIFPSLVGSVFVSHSQSRFDFPSEESRRHR